MELVQRPQTPGPQVTGVSVRRSLFPVNLSNRLVVTAKPSEWKTRVCQSLRGSPTRKFQ